jgi:hypothetical protein
MRGAKCGMANAFAKFLFVFSYLARQLAETEGFEPSVPVNPVRRFSKPLVSATHPRLRLQQMRGYSEGRREGQRL